MIFTELDHDISAETDLKLRYQQYVSAQNNMHSIIHDGMNITQYDKDWQSLIVVWTNISEKLIVDVQLTPPHSVRSYALEILTILNNPLRSFFGQRKYGL